MSATVSVVVPTRNSARSLERCLRSIRHQAHVRPELVVVDNASTDATRRIAERLADVVIDGGPERSAQRNLGAKVAKGGILLFVDDDMVLEPGVVDEVVELVRDGAASVVVPERSFGQGFWARCKALEKLVALGDPAVEAARGFRREDFVGVGGYDETLTACEDWDLADRVAARSGTAPARTSSIIWHDEGRLRLRTSFAKKRYYGRWVARWSQGAPAHRRRRSLSAAAPRLAAQPLTACGLALLKVVEVAGFALGVRDGRRSGT